jgi:hypothetical protein
MAPGLFMIISPFGRVAPDCPCRRMHASTGRDLMAEWACRALVRRVRISPIVKNILHFEIDKPDDRHHYVSG